MSEATRVTPAGVRPRTAGALITVGYAAAVYLIFLAVLGYAIGFFIGAGVPKGIDQGSRAPLPLAVAADLALLLLFAVQHTVMARSWFKRWWARVVPQPAERATYVLCAALALALLFGGRLPVGGVAWHASGLASGLLLALYASGWAWSVTANLMILHPHLFGRQ